MTYSNYNKVFKQLRAKPVKLAKYIKHNSPKERKFGPTTKHCRICGNERCHIRKYGLDVCRRCFRQYATDIGYKKYN